MQTVMVSTVSASENLMKTVQYSIYKAISVAITKLV